MKFFEKKIFLFITCGFILTASAQPVSRVPIPEIMQFDDGGDTAAKIFISAIRIQGNKKTKDYIIQREMRFKEGDSISARLLGKLVQQSRNLIYNTTLFTEVTIIPSQDSAGASFNIVVREKWYLYPSPQFKLVDRNINEWLNRFNGDLNRVIYGAKFAHYNFSGRRDQLRIYLLTGYARNISITYSAPYSNPALTEGFAVSAGYTQNREVGYKTNTRNVINAFRSEGFVRQSVVANVGYIIRRGHFNSHVITAGYSYIKVHDSVAIKTNSGYFNSNRSSVGFPNLSYSFRHINVDNVSYPLKGIAYSFSLFKRGPGFTGGINVLELVGSGSAFKAHGKNWYSTAQITGLLKAPFNVAYINRRALGFEDFYMRGLENYVIDGVAAAVAKYTLKKKILSFNIPVPFNIRILPKIPVVVFAKTFADAGTSYIPSQFNTMLNNRLLYTAGFGLDILTLYDINFRFEYSFNQLGQNGLFLHVKGGF